MPRLARLASPGVLHHVMLAVKVCNFYGVTLDEMRSGRRGHEVVEAHQLRELVNDMPEPRRSEIRARFGTERLRLPKSGLLEKLLVPERLKPEERTLFALDYFIQGIACPFLEEESCSIYNDRPIPCREYLVVSPAENCAKPSPDAVKCLKIPAEVSRAVRCFNPEQSPGRWVTLILALAWASAHPDKLLLRLGTELVHELLSRLVGKEIPGPAT